MSPRAPVNFLKSPLPIILFISILFFALSPFSPSFSQALAAIYYVDATNGNDSNNGTSELTTWKTIAKVNNSKFLPGDQILFKRGEVWRETLLVSSSGSSQNPITFGAYGSGAKPVINGSDIITLWSREDGYLYLRKTTVSAEPMVVWENGSRLMKQTSIQNVNDTPGSWYWNSNTLYLRATAGTPDSNGEQYEACQRTNSIGTEGRTYLVFENIALYRGGNGNGTQFQVSPPTADLTIRSCDFLYSATKHISLWKLNGDVLIQDCVFSYTGECRLPGPGNTWSAIWIGSDQQSNHTIIVEKSRFEHIADYIGDQYQSHGVYITSDRLVYRYNYHLGGLQSGAAVRMAGNVKNGCEIYYNVITGGDSYCSWGVYNANGSDHLVYNNVFYNVSRGVIQDSGPWGNGHGITVKNNIFYLINTYHHLFDVSSNLGTFISDYNVFFVEAGRDPTFFWDNLPVNGLANWINSSGQDRHSKYSDPLFKLPLGKDFSLQASSPCIDGGTQVGLTRDIGGNLVPQGQMPDIGAFEYGVIHAPKNLRVR